MELTPATANRYIDHAFAQMLAVAARVGESKINERPIGPETNAIAALIIHCCGVVEFWLGHVALAEPSDRDRDAEFSRTATLSELAAHVADARGRARSHLERLEEGDGRDEGGRQFLLERDASDASVVLHVLEELYQHLGHMELTADVLTARSD